jgi:hypothetical protein
VDLPPIVMLVPWWCSSLSEGEVNAKATPIEVSFYKKQKSSYFFIKNSYLFVHFYRKLLIF